MRIQINVSEEMNTRIEKLAKDYGVSKSSFCSMILGQSVTSMEHAYRTIENAANNAMVNLKK